MKWLLRRWYVNRKSDPFVPDLTEAELNEFRKKVILTDAFIEQNPHLKGKSTEEIIKEWEKGK